MKVGWSFDRYVKPLHNRCIEIKERGIPPTILKAKIWPYFIFSCNRNYDKLRITYYHLLQFEVLWLLSP